MARGHARAPSQNAYRGSIGRTQTETVHITGPKGDLQVGTVYTTIDAVSDPELVERLHSEDPARTLNMVRVDGAEHPMHIAVPVVYHDPAAELMVLVLGEAHRHREIEERIRLLERLVDDDATIPAYVKDFAVVFGAAGLRAYLEDRAQQALTAARSHDSSKEIDRRRAEVVAREDELARQRAELERVKSMLEHERAEQHRAQLELEKLRAEQRARVIASVQVPAEATTIGPPPQQGEDMTSPIAKRTEFSTEIQIETTAPSRSNGRSAGIEFDEETTGTSIIPAGSDPLTTDTIDLGPIHPDPWLEFAATGTSSSFEVRDGAVRIALLASEQVARGLGGVLDVRVLLHRVTTYPVVTFVIGPPAALRVPSPSQLATLSFDIGADLDRAVLAALAKRFDLTLIVIHRGAPIRNVRLVAPLADNLAYILRAADDHLRAIAGDGETEPSFQRARELVLGPGYDLLGTEHAEAAEFRDDKLAQLQTAQQLRRAIAIARRFARPSREDYLICSRGFPLARWRELRRHVLESAVAWGIWMGPELAQVAVSEGLARSRRDLIVKLDAGFEALRRHPTAFDIDADAAEDNVKALAEEARALGVEMRRKGGNGSAIKSEDVPMVSGSIEGTPAKGVPRTTTTEELMALLDDKKQRVTAAAELCDRGDPRAAAAVIAAVKKMSRAEAVRILGKSVKFGPIAAGPLIEGLASSKAFLRHGCALALALLRTDEGTYAVIDLLVNEPTEVWREIARALGQVGPGALMPLASHVGRLGDRMTPQLQERVAWAMSHVGVRGGKSALEQMAAGQSVMAPIAREALKLLDTAARDEVRVQPDAAPTRDVTVNRAFSRRFFEALEPSNPDLAQAALHDLDASGPMEVLDEADLISEEEDEAELDESDLIQT